MKPCIVFYAGLLYRQFDTLDRLTRNELPDGAYLYFKNAYHFNYWYRKDMTPVLLVDVPKELRVLLLLLT